MIREVKSLVIVFAVYMAIFMYNGLVTDTTPVKRVIQEEFLNPRVINVPIIECNGEQVSLEKIDNIFSEDLKK